MRFVRCIVLLLLIVSLFSCSQRVNFDVINIESSYENYTWVTFINEDINYLGIMNDEGFITVFFRESDVVFHSEILGGYSYVQLSNNTYLLINAIGDIVSKSQDSLYYEEMFNSREIQSLSGQLLYKETENNKELKKFRIMNVRVIPGASVDYSDLTS